MEKTPNLKLKTNLDHVVTLMYDSPKSGEGQYGTWYRYAIMHDGVEKCIFATEFLNDKLQHYGKGDVINVRKEETEDGKIQWNVIPEDGTDVKRDRGVSAGTNGVPVNTPTPQPQPDWHHINTAKSYDIHKQVCLKLAIQLEHGKKTDFKRIAKNMDRLISVLEDDYARAEGHITSASNIYHLQAIWAKYAQVWVDTLTQDQLGHLDVSKNEMKETFRDEPTKAEENDELPF